MSPDTSAAAPRIAATRYQKLADLMHHDCSLQDDRSTTFSRRMTTSVAAWPKANPGARASRENGVSNRSQAGQDSEDQAQKQAQLPASGRGQVAAQDTDP